MLTNGYQDGDCAAVEQQIDKNHGLKGGWFLVALLGMEVLRISWSDR